MYCDIIKGVAEFKLVSFRQRHLIYSYHWVIEVLLVS